ncbi:MAG: hypothetical protein IT439_06885 [Phycisphaerales bacterium]|nr:hypothetical protein [Phycisphaerales bacterium]
MKFGIGTIAAFALSGLAQAQFLTPPPANPGALDRPVYVPPQPPKELVRDIAERNAAKARQKAAEEEARRQAQQLPQNLPYTSLVTRDDAGKVIRLAEDPDLVALRGNPMLSEETRALALEVAAERQARYDDLVIRNLELLEDLDGGLLDSLNVFDRAALNDIRQRLKIFQGEARLSTELERREVITPLQARFNMQMVGEYDLAVKDEELGAKPATDVMLRYLMRQGLREGFLAYDALLRTVAANADIALAEAGVGTALAADLASAGQDAAAVKKVLSELTLDQRRAVLEVARDIRAAER